MCQIWAAVSAAGYSATPAEVWAQVPRGYLSEIQAENKPKKRRKRK